MLSWSDQLLESIDEMVQQDGYPVAAHYLSEQLGQFIDPEQLRGARRRWQQRVLRGERRGVSVLEAIEPAYKPRDFTLLKKMPDNFTLTLGALGDTHLGSKYERIDILQELYDIYEQEGVSIVFHTGNFIEGEARFNEQDINVHGMDNQLKYFVDKYPQRKGITTYYIGGDDHEGWYTQREGIDAGERLEDIALRAGRKDLVYLGYMERDIPIAPNYDKVIRVQHPGGGSAQAVSWTSQKIIAAIEHDDVMPLIMLIGHYHKAEFLPNYRGSYIFQTGTFQEQSPFMRKKLLRADIGAWIIRITFVNGTVSRVGGEFVSFKRNAWKYL